MSTSYSVTQQSSMLNRLILFVASLLSLGFSLIFWSSLGTGLLQVCLLVLSLVLEGTKWLSWKQCQKSYRDGHLGSLCFSGGLFTLLLAISVIGSSLQLHRSYVAQRIKALESSTQYQSLAFQVDQQQTHIAALMENAKRDSDNGFRTRAQQVLRNDVVEAQKVLGHLLQEQSEHNQRPLSGMDLGNVPQLELVLCFVLGGLLDIVLMFLFWSCSGNIPDNERIPRNENVPPVRKRKVHTQENKHHSYENVRHLITRRQCQPTVQSLKKQARIGTKTAQGFLASLEEEGVLVRKSQRYQLVGI